MTPQGNFTILAPIVLSREAELRGLLASMNEAPGLVNPNNPLVPFAQFDTLHFARFVILDDKTVADLRVYGLPIRTFPLYLAFLGDIDGEEEAFLNELGTCVQRLARDLFMLPWIRVRHRSYGLDKAAAQSRQRGLCEHTRAYCAADPRRSGIAGCDRKPPCKPGVLLGGSAAAGSSCAAKAVRGGGKIRGPPYSVRRGGPTPIGWWIRKTVAPDLHALVAVTGFAAADS